MQLIYFIACYRDIHDYSWKSFTTTICFNQTRFPAHNGSDMSCHRARTVLSERTRLLARARAHTSQLEIYRCRPCRPKENKTLRLAPRETSADDLWVETISAPCNIHHERRSPAQPAVVPAAGTFQQKKKNYQGGQGGGCPAKSLMGYRVPWGKWPQGALLGTSRGRVAEPEGFWDSIKLDNAIMRRPLSTALRLSREK